MRRTLRVATLVMMLSLTFTPPGRGADDRTSAVTIRGIVEVEMENDDGTIATVGIWDRTRREYFSIDPAAGKGKELAERVDEYVEASGTVTTDENGFHTLVVTEFRAVDPPADEHTEPSGPPTDEVGPDDL